MEEKPNRLWLTPADYATAAAARDHAGANATMGRAVADMEAALKAYCRGYLRMFDSPVGEDHVLGDEGVALIAQGLRILLIGPTGQIECGPMDTAIKATAATHGFADKIHD